MAANTEARKLNYTAIFISVCCLTALLLSFGGILGWIIHNPFLVQVLPTYSSMKFNTALMLFLSATSLFYLNLHKHRLSFCLAAPVLCGATITLAQHVSGVDFGIDELFVHPFLQVGTFSAARMAPNTALALLLLSFAICAASSRKLFGIGGESIATLLGGLVAALAVVPLVGYIAGVEAAYAWKNSAGMAVHTAISFLFLGVGLLVCTCNITTSIQRYLPVSVGIALLVVTLSMTMAVRGYEELEFKKTIQAETDFMASRTKTALSRFFEAVNRISNRWVAANGTPKDLWEKDCQSYLKDYPFLEALEWVDSNGILQWSESRDGNQKLVGQKLNTEGTRLDAAQEAMRTRLPQLTKSVDLIQGGKGFIYFSPLFLNNQFNGFIVAVFRMNELFERIHNTAGGMRYYITLHDGENIVFSDLAADAPDPKFWQRDTEVTILNKKFLLSESPAADTLANRNSRLKWLVCGSGLTTTFLVILSLLLAARWRDNAASRKKSEELIRLLVDGVRDYAICRLDKEGNVASWNKGAERIKGYQADEIIGRHYSIFYPDEDKAKGIPERNLKEADIVGQYVYEGWRVRKNGQRFWANVVINALRDVDGKLIGFAKITRDLTGQRELEQRAVSIIEEEKTRLSDIVAIQRDIAFEHHDVEVAMKLIVERVMAVTNATGSVIEMHENNEMVYRAASGSAAPFIGSRIKASGSLSGLCVRENKVLKCDDAETDKRVDKDACRKIGVASMVVVPLMRLKQPVGVLKVLSSKPFAFDDKHVATLELMAGVLSAAISDAVAHENLAQSEETFRSAMNNAAIGMGIVSIEGKWLRVNRSLCTLLGYSEAELLKTDFQTITHPDDLEADLDQVRKMLARKIDNYQMEKRYYHKDGHIVWVLLSVSLVWTIEGKPEYFIAQIQDITERKKISLMKDEFTAMVSHELRTPLTSIRGALGLMANGVAGALPAKAADLTKIAYESCERLMRIINDILDVEKMESGKLQISITSVEVDPFLKRVLEANQPYGDKYNVAFKYMGKPTAAVIMADADRLMQIFSNLLSNAAKFSHSGGEVHILTKQVGKGEDAKMRFFVRDHGSGIPAAFRSRVFEKFAQAEDTNTRRHDGTGLGLSLVKKLVEAMHGKIDFTSETGIGTTFFFDLPCVEDAETTIPASNTSSKPEMHGAK